MRKLLQLTIVAILSVPIIWYVIGVRVASERKAAADREWSQCVSRFARSDLTQEITTSGGALVASIGVHCERELGAVRLLCSEQNDCFKRTEERTLDRIEFERQLIDWEQKETRSRALIDQAISDLEKSGVSRADIRAYFRDEILDDEEEDKKREEEALASAASDRERRFGRY
jgi:hypothetical protein